MAAATPNTMSTVAKLPPLRTGALGAGAWVFAGAAAAGAAPWWVGALAKVELGAPVAGGKGAAGAAAGFGAAAGATGAAAAAGAADGVGAGGPPTGMVGSLIVEAACLGGGVGKGIRTVSFLGCTFAASAGLGGMPPGLGVFSDIKLYVCETRVGSGWCQTSSRHPQGFYHRGKLNRALGIDRSPSPMPWKSRLSWAFLS